MGGPHIALVIIILQTRPEMIDWKLNRIIVRGVPLDILGVGVSLSDPVRRYFHQVY